MLLGLKGTMSEAELHVLRARLLGGIRNKAARGELRRGLPVGFVWGEKDGEVCFHPDEAVCGAIRTVFTRFASSIGAPCLAMVAHRGPVVPDADPLRRRCALDRPQLHRRLSCAHESGLRGRLRVWQEPHEVILDASGTRKKRVRKLPRSQMVSASPERHPS